VTPVMPRRGSGTKNLSIVRSRNGWIFAAELAAFAILSLLAFWRWGAIAALGGVAIAGGFVFAAFWWRDHLADVLIVGGATAVLVAIFVTVAYHGRLHEQAGTVASMKRIAVALDHYAREHRGLYPDGARFPAALQRYDPEASLEDAWGHQFRYAAIDRLGLPTGLGSGPGFILQSVGADGLPRPNYIGDVYNWPRTVLGLSGTGKDLMMVNGVFIQGPRYASE